MVYESILLKDSQCLLAPGGLLVVYFHRFCTFLCIVQLPQHYKIEIKLCKCF